MATRGDDYQPYRPPWLREPIACNVPRWIYGTFATVTVLLVLLATRVRIDTQPRVWTHTWESVPDVVVPYLVTGSLALLLGLCWWSNRISLQTCQKAAWIINCWTLLVVLGTMLFFAFINES